MPAGRGQNRTTYARSWDGKELPSRLPDDMVGELEVTRMPESEYGHIEVADLAIEEVYEAEKKGISKQELRLIVIGVIKKLGCPGAAASVMASDPYMNLVVKYLCAAKRIQRVNKTPGVYTVLSKAPVGIDRDAALHQLLETCEKQKSTLIERAGVITEQAEQIDKLTRELQSLKERPPVGADPEVLKQLLAKCEELREARQSALQKFEDEIQVKQREVDRLQIQLNESEEERKQADASNFGLTTQCDELRKQLMEVVQERDELLTRIDTLEKVAPQHSKLDVTTMNRLKELGIDV